MQVLLTNAPKDTQVGTERRLCSLTGIAVGFAAAIPIVIPRPPMHTVIIIRGVLADTI